MMNILGRFVPDEVRGKGQIPYSGPEGISPFGEREIGRVFRHRDKRRSKIVPNLKEAIGSSGLSDGMTISFHHHLRNGDAVVNMVMKEISEMGIRGLRVYPSALFPVHEPLLNHIDDGTIGSIEGSLNGPLGKAASLGRLKDPVVLRSHSGRVAALARGEVEIDVAFLGVSCCDEMGNANGVKGRSAFGPCNFPKADAHFARYTVLITDNLVRFPCTPISIPGTDVDMVVEVDSIGDPSQILSGSIQLTTDPSKLAIAHQVMDILEIGALLEDGFSFQAGSGGISLALTKFIGERLKKKNKKASFALGGTTRYLVDMLEGGSLKVLLDGQCFDTDAVRSLLKNDNHLETFVDQYGNLHTGATFTEKEQTAFLSATEIDIDFNVNVNTHSDGWLLHGIGGHQDVAYGSNLTFVTIPLVRKNNPIVKERVLTVTTPGDLIDIVVTERGISFNTSMKDTERRSRNEELEVKCRKKGLEVFDISDLRNKALAQGAVDIEPRTTDDIFGVVKYIDGTVLDSLYMVKG